MIAIAPIPMPSAKQQPIEIARFFHHARSLAPASASNASSTAWMPLEASQTKTKVATGPSRPPS